ncbi:hypothetical protein PAAG_11604 [Paracoccidioides lutzii Pb01]|uniref:Uncharacterized protein n=1 Tax=Paracoccidioides lutzii (strain ATCC MYA-826 / Pb01) TaxID=502779 RepID=A0A0A2V5L8_PARBA|nr:hypothetical protein PAAG_11604 [Paracoccidioides lutzii Pb01]KGQ01622.1 hypothetical protein PAAG_11604 [Paracoccidioides lutzii Pb01]
MYGVRERRVNDELNGWESSICTTQEKQFVLVSIRGRYAESRAGPPGGPLDGVRLTPPTLLLWIDFVVHMDSIVQPQTQCEASNQLAR